MTFIEPFGRTITYLRISLTDCCNWGEVYYMPQNGLPGQPRMEQLSADEIAWEVEAAASGGVTREPDGRLEYYLWLQEEEVQAYDKLRLLNMLAMRLAKKVFPTDSLYRILL